MVGRTERNTPHQPQTPLPRNEVRDRNERARRERRTGFATRDGFETGQARPKVTDMPPPPQREEGGPVETAVRTAEGIRDAAIEGYERVRDYVAFHRAAGNVDHMAEYLRSDRYTQEEKDTLLRYALTDVEAGLRFFDTHQYNVQRHVTARGAVAGAVHDALQRGAISREMLEGFARRSPDHAKRLAQSLVLDPRNAEPGGALELVGQVAREEAEKTDHRRAKKDWVLTADIALTSSEALIERHYPTAEDRAEARDRMDKTLRTDSRFRVRGMVLPSRDDDRKTARNQAVAGFLRLAAADGGDPRAEGHIRSLSPDEAIALVGSLDRPGDRGPGAASPMQQVIRAYEGQPRFARAYAAAITSSDALMEEHLPKDPEKAYEVLQRLTEDLERFEDEPNRPLMPGHRAARDGATRLLTQRADDVYSHGLKDDQTRRNLLPTLESALSRTAMSPSTDKAAKDAILAAVDGQIDRITRAADTSPAVSGLQLGALLGTLHNAADKALDRGSQVDVRGFWHDFGGRFLGKVLGAQFKNPLISAIVDPGTNTFLRPAFDRAAARGEAERAFRAELERTGAQPEVGQRLIASSQQLLAEEIDLIGQAIEAAQRPGAPVTREQLDALRDHHRKLIALQSAMGDGYSMVRERSQRAVH